RRGPRGLSSPGLSGVGVLFLFFAGEPYTLALFVSRGISMAGPILVTGGCGFLRRKFIPFLLETELHGRTVYLVLLPTAGNLANLKDVADSPRYRFVHGDITDRVAVRRIAGEGLTGIINFAAESHVDRSIMDSGPFLHTNVIGTQILLDAAREFNVPRF